MAIAGGDAESDMCQPGASAWSVSDPIAGANKRLYSSVR
ncbi:hypothetical protein I552_8523 [Mycobacterium xenopi 3993]|nr:hypothetical protein I552_8523 [Mycobacterium xenopi 3993]